MTRLEWEPVSASSGLLIEPFRAMNREGKEPRGVDDSWRVRHEPLPQEVGLIRPFHILRDLGDLVGFRRNWHQWRRLTRVPG